MTITDGAEDDERALQQRQVRDLQGLEGQVAEARPGVHGLDQ